ncbi:zinc finger protein 83-like, partial [Sitodiplosis mosellana]|uniref:zinc finger protein 83-like n=1 Tax=Sitodiplosis mosellana TaxID=263140 RepID=UPI0024440570
MDLTEAPKPTKVKTAPNLAGNEKIQPKEKHKCELGDKCFVNANELKQHAETHVGKGHTCPVCGKSFSRADYREHHINSAHKGEVVDGVVRKPTYEQMCEICSKVFHHYGNLRKHMILHSGERPFSCTECGKTFAWNQHLKSHMKLVHSDEKSFQCSICGKLFNHSGNYKKHMRIHTGEKPYQCEICQKQFAQSSNYQV